jgi:hypothetical protein
MSRLFINLNNLSGILFSSRYSRKLCIISLSFKRSLVDKFLISVSPNVKWFWISSNYCFGSSTRAHFDKSASSSSSNLFSIDIFRFS